MPSVDDCIEVHGLTVQRSDLDEMEAAAAENGAAGGRSGAVRFCAIQYIRLTKALRQAGIDPLAVQAPAKSA